MDLDENLIGSVAGKAPTRKFLPKSAKPRSAKPEPLEPPEPKPEPRDPVSITKTEKVEDVAKPEPPNGAVKMEVEAAKPEEETADHMEVDTEADEAEVGGEEEEDVVVRSIDVFNVPSIDPGTQLHIMQYPTRPSWRPYDLDGRCQEVRMKPGTSDWEIDLKPIESSDWDADKARKNQVEKQVLFTAWDQRPAVNAITVAVLRGNELYLNPVHSVVQLRQSLERLTSDGLKKKNNFPSEEVNVKVEDSAERKPTSSKKQNKQVESDNEPVPVTQSWARLQYHGSKSDLSSLYLKKMVTRENSPINFTMSPHEYVRSLCPVPSENTKNKGPSRRSLISLPLKERVKKLLLEGAPVKRFSLFKRLATGHSIEELLDVLQLFGRLIQGLWVPKTDIVIDSSSLDERLAREYVLLMFSKNLVVSSSEFDICDVKLRDKVKKFRSLFAVELPSSRDWKFKENRDASFIEQYPKIVEGQSSIRKNIENLIMIKPCLALKNTSAAKNDIPRTLVVSNPIKPSNTDQGMEKKIERCTQKGSSKRMFTVETREALLKALPKVFQTHKVCSLQFIYEDLRGSALSWHAIPKADPRNAVAAATAPPAELEEVISEVATNIHGFYVLKSSPDHPEYDQLRKVVIDLLLARGSNAKVKKAEVLEAARLALKREVSNLEYNKVMTDFCVTRGSGWVLKGADGKP